MLLYEAPHPRRPLPSDNETTVHNSSSHQPDRRQHQSRRCAVSVVMQAVLRIPSRLPFAPVAALRILLVTVLLHCCFTQPIATGGTFLLSDELDGLSDAELLDLYIQHSESSLLQQSANDAHLIAPGNIILQAGMGWSHDRDELGLDLETVTWPDFLLRYRLTQRTELRLGWSGQIHETLHDTLTGAVSDSSYLADPSIGVRFGLATQDGWIPQTALTLSSPVNTRTDTDLLSRFNPLATLSYSWQLDDDWLLNGNSGLAWLNGDAARVIDLQQSASLDFLIDDHWDVYAEWFARFPDGDGSAQHSLGPGLNWGITPHCQIGLSVSAGLNSQAPDLLAQWTVTWRP